MRILKFVGAFLLTFLIIFFIVFGFNLDALITLFENREGIQEGQEWVAKTYSLKGLTEYIGEQPARVSIGSITVANPDSSILYNEHTPRTMGRLSNIFLVIEYARQVESKKLDPDEQVSLQKVNQYQLPYMDASNHEDAIASLGERNKISGVHRVALSDLIQIAVEYNDLAVSDYLLYKIGLERVENVMDRLSLEETELPLPFCGLYIALNPYLYDASAKAHVDSLSTLSRTEFNETVLDAGRQFTQDPGFRKKVLDIFNEQEGLGMPFTLQRDGLDFFPKTTAAEMTQLMKKLLSDKLINKKVSLRIKNIMDWPLESERLQKDFKTYGAMYDSRLGMVNGIDYGVSSYSDEAFAQAVFFDNLQVAFWFHMSSNLMHQDFEQRLIWDPALRQATVKQITKNE